MRFHINFKKISSTLINYFWWIPPTEYLATSLVRNILIVQVLWWRNACSALLLVLEAEWEEPDVRSEQSDAHAHADRAHGDHQNSRLCETNIYYRQIYSIDQHIPLLLYSYFISVTVNSNELYRVTFSV